MTFSYYDSVSEYAIVKKVWNTLINGGAKHSFFLSWEWIESWIVSLSKENISVTLVVLDDNSRPISAFFIGENAINRHWIVSGTSLSINSTNDPYYDDLCIEYNSMLTAPGYTLDYEKIFHALDSVCIWNELYFPAIGKDEYQQIIQDLHRYNAVNVGPCKISPSYYVDLDKIRENQQNYLGLLSKNRKKQIKSSINAYKNLGGVSIKTASTTKEALSMLDKLIEAHQKDWNRRGQPGVFSNKFLRNFHKKLIKNHFSKQCIQLLQISFGGNSIGYLYNFVYLQKVYFYQSGFQYMKENKYRPGLVSHYYAILLNVKLGNKIYDFLEGDAAYKKSMATDSSDLIWLILQKKELQFWVENQLKSILHYIREW